MILTLGLPAASPGAPVMVEKHDFGTRAAASRAQSAKVPSKVPYLK